MRLLGLALVVGGWVLAVAGLFISSANSVRAIIACIGIAVSLAGSLGVLNRFYLERAIWKK